MSLGVDIAIEKMLFEVVVIRRCSPDYGGDARNFRGLCVSGLGNCGRTIGSHGAYNAARPRVLPRMISWQSCNDGATVLHPGDDRDLGHYALRTEQDL